MGAIVNARIFDGIGPIEADSVVFSDGIIKSVGGIVPQGEETLDARGATLLPGLIDSHVHTDMGGLADALKFGVTTELEMMGSWSARQRRQISERHDIADLRSPGMGVTPHNGHPTQYMKDSDSIAMRLIVPALARFMFLSNPSKVRQFVRRQVRRGADYIKVFIEDGTCVGYPGLPTISDETLAQAIDEAHLLARIAIAHVTTAHGTARAIRAGIDGLGHLFFDRAPSQGLVAEIASSGAFVIPTLVTLSSAFGNKADWLAKDPRVASRLDSKWLESLSRSMDAYPQGNLEEAFATVRALRDAGVDILAGSDVSDPIPILGGLAHGASLHHELQLLVKAGLTNAQALRAATSTPARRFSLDDRGRIAVGMRADLVLIDGDPTSDIADTLSIAKVWRGGVSSE